MRILFAADNHPYTEYALQELTYLAENTFAGVTLLAVSRTRGISKSSQGLVRSDMLEDPLFDALGRHRTAFLKHWPEGESPYSENRVEYEWVMLSSEAWEQIKVCRGSMKDLNVRVRFGNTVKEILAESKETGSDLIVLGCTKGSQCLWEDIANVPEKIVNEADCSVLLVKEAQPIQNIYACLDASNISQESLEMINQMVTIHKAKLELITLTKGSGIKADVYPVIDNVYNYFNNEGIDVTLKYSEISDFEPFIEKEVQQGLLALWMGKKSLLDRFFARESLGRFVKTCRTSVLILR